mmetsp:Transcript_40991/g.87311  ORF Transcript_40991/g.87311 Transcript_40991/m.87311 type:complete len:345 (+) Transcript_40991:58-1092(+)
MGAAQSAEMLVDEDTQDTDGVEPWWNVCCTRQAPLDDLHGPTASSERGFEEAVPSSWRGWPSLAAEEALADEQPAHGWGEWPTTSPPGTGEVCTAEDLIYVHRVLVTLMQRVVVGQERPKSLLQRLASLEAELNGKEEEPAAGGDEGRGTADAKEPRSPRPVGIWEELAELVDDEAAPDGGNGPDSVGGASAAQRPRAGSALAPKAGVAMPRVDSDAWADGDYQLMLAQRSAQIFTKTCDRWVGQVCLSIIMVAASGIVGFPPGQVEKHIHGVRAQLTAQLHALWEAEAPGARELSKQLAGLLGEPAKFLDNITQDFSRAQPTSQGKLEPQVASTRGRSVWGGA